MMMVIMKALMMKMVSTRVVILGRCDDGDGENGGRGYFGDAS